MIDDRIETIVGYKTWSDRKKLDELLRMDASLYVNLGVDSTQKERDEVKRTSKKIYTAIKRVDERMGSDFLRVLDK